MEKILYLILLSIAAVYGLFLIFLRKEKNTLGVIIMLLVITITLQVIQFKEKPIYPVVEQVHKELSKNLIKSLTIDNELNPKHGVAILHNEKVVYFDIVKEDGRYYVQNIKP